MMNCEEAFLGRAYVVSLSGGDVGVVLVPVGCAVQRE